MSNYKAFLVIFILLGIWTSSFGQNEADNSQKERAQIWDNVIFGGNIGAAFGNNTVLEFSPTIGYKLSDKLLTGTNMNFIYFSNQYERGYIYGPGIFLRYAVMDGLFLHTEYQQSYTDVEIRNTDYRFKTDFPMFLVGGGYSTPIGGNARLGITILIDLIEDQNSFYQNPIIRGGVLFGL